MKYNKFFCTLIAIASVSCTTSNADDNPNPRPGKDQGEEKPVTSDITSIYDLNQNKGYLNSHAATWQNSVLEMDYSSIVTLEQPKITPAYPMYPRIKKLANGSYLLIYQQNLSAHDVYYAKSMNLTSWTEGGSPLFEKTDMNQYESSVKDRVLFSSADAIVLSNGDILAFASFRLNKGYRLNNLNNGIMMRRSSDNGASWSEPQIIYRGTTWEPSALQLASGEVHVYFTSSDPILGDSGTALLRSTDNGKSWTSVGKIIRQRAGTAMDGSGQTIFTDQMPVAIQLNGKDRIAVALESRFGRTGTSADQYNLTMAYSSDNWASGGLTGDAEGPADRKSSIFTDEAAPYLRQFRSGETMLSCNAGKTFYIRMGNALADKFGTPMPSFEKGCWGSLEIIDNHTVVGVFPTSWSETSNGEQISRSRINIAKFVLNHRINAAVLTPETDGSSKDWKDVDDALFIGSAGKTGTTFRFAYDNDNVYGMIERKDASLTSSDECTVMLQSGNSTGTPVSLKFSFKDGKIVCSDANVKVASCILGTLDDTTEDDGLTIEFSIPKSFLGIVSDKLLFNAVVKDDISGEDTFFGLTANNYQKWIPIELKPAAEPAPVPDPGQGEFNSDGPKWSEGDEVNPWN